MLLSTQKAMQLLHLIIMMISVLVMLMICGCPAGLQMAIGRITATTTAHSLQAHMQQLVPQAVNYKTTALTDGGLLQV